MSQPSAPSLFHRSISHALSSWPALATCVRVGGRDSAEKATWLIDATEQWMTENQGIEPEELAEFYQDVFWNEFDTLVDDGSLGHISKTICEYQQKIKRGLKSEVEAAIREAPKITCSVSVAPENDDDNESGDDDDDDPVGATSGRDVNGGSGVNGEVSVTNRQSDDVRDDDGEKMEVDGEAEEEEEGWTTVKKGGKKKK